MQTKSTYNDILLEILSIIDYPNKEKFVTEFESLNHLDAMANILPQLSPEVQEYIKKEQGDPEKIKNYIPQDAYVREVTAVTAAALGNFITSIASSLSLEQKERVVKLVSSL